MRRNGVWLITIIFSGFAVVIGMMFSKDIVANEGGTASSQVSTTSTSQAIERVVLHGLVIGGANEPLPNAVVTYRIEVHYPIPKRVVDYATPKSVRTDADGRFTIDEEGVYLQILDIRLVDSYWLLDYGDPMGENDNLTTFNGTFSNLLQRRYIADYENPAIFPVVPLSFDGELKMTRGGQDVFPDGTVVTNQLEFAYYPSIGPRSKLIRDFLLNRRSARSDATFVRRLRDEVTTSSTQPLKD